ncbi:uncharacterized protein LOC135627586 [Musa acuminata AAA Group]|uniref:uncharacterized protein LOC135627586 n=1 Tax=Musa acuminata AAA Group TaxID=214697 RepID=UPI0031E2DE8B
MTSEEHKRAINVVQKRTNLSWLMRLGLRLQLSNSSVVVFDIGCLESSWFGKNASDKDEAIGSSNKDELVDSWIKYFDLPQWVDFNALKEDQWTELLCQSIEHVASFRETAAVTAHLGVNDLHTRLPLSPVVLSLRFSISRLPPSPPFLVVSSPPVADMGKSVGRGGSYEAKPKEKPSPVSSHKDEACVDAVIQKRTPLPESIEAQQKAERLKLDGEPIRSTSINSTSKGGGNIRSTSINGVKLYSLSSQRSVATWLPPKKLRALRKDKDYMQRVDLIQDLRFETATTKIKVTPDGDYVIASGIYPPQVKVFELRELSLKFERHLVSEIINFQVLADDYSKIAFLCADRSVCLHAKYGSHYSLRIPRMGRDIAYDSWSCDLLCAASSPDLYRINLEQVNYKVFVMNLNTLLLYFFLSRWFEMSKKINALSCGRVTYI